MVTVDSVLDEISALSLDDMELVEEVLHKRIIDEKREAIYKNFIEAEKEYKEGKLKFSSSVNELKKMLD